MNWRTIVGLIFLCAGMIRLYQLIADNLAHKLSGSPIYAEIGCCVWMCVGIFLMINGFKNKEN